MPLVEITTGSDFFSEEEKIKLSKAIYNCMLGVYEEVKGIKPHVWVIIRETHPNNYLVDGETLTEVRKKREAQK